MNKYTVGFYNKKVVVWAKDHNSAVKKALQKKPISIAVITTCLKDGDEEIEEMLYHYKWLINNNFIKKNDFEYYN